MAMPLLRLIRADARGRAAITGRKIYLLPTLYGLVFGVLLLTLLVASINYGNNLAFLLTFLLAGIFFQAIFHTWRNLQGLTLETGEPEPAFVGDAAQVPVRLVSDGRNHYSIQLGFEGNPPQLVDVPGHRPARLRLACRTRRRGLQPCGLLIVETRYPLGLLRAWSRIDTGLEVLGWPRPLGGLAPPGDPAGERGRHGDQGPGNDDFLGYRNYQPGDPGSRIHWKALAAEKGLQVKQFGGAQAPRLWLDFERLSEPDPERRLQILAAAVEELHHQEALYGLRLPDLEIPPEQGPAQRRRCLDALGLFGEPEAR